MVKIGIKAEQGWKKNTRIHPVLTPRFATNLKALREDHNYTHATLAEKAGCTAPYISMLEAGAKTPSFDMVERFAKVFGVDPAYMLRETKGGRG